jgi:hypothetical protein
MPAAAGEVRSGRVARWEPFAPAGRYPHVQHEGYGSISPAGYNRNTMPREWRGPTADGQQLAGCPWPAQL